MFDTLSSDAMTWVDWLSTVFSNISTLFHAGTDLITTRPPGFEATADTLPGSYDF